MHNELERIWKVVALGSNTALPVRTDKNHDIPHERRYHNRSLPL